MSTNYIFPTLVAVSLGLLSGCISKHQSSDDPSDMAVDVAFPEVDSITLTTTYPGYLLAASKIDVVGRVNGLLVSKNYTGGQYVEKGSVLFRIEDGKYQDAVKQASAALSTAKSTFNC